MKAELVFSLTCAAGALWRVGTCIIFLAFSPFLSLTLHLQFVCDPSGIPYSAFVATTTAQHSHHNITSLRGILDTEKQT